MEPARGETFPFGQRRCPAAPGEDNFPSPDQTYFQVLTTPTARGRKRRSPGSIPPRTVWKLEPHWLVADWLRLMEPAWVESGPSGQHRDPSAPGEDKVSSPDEKSFLPLKLQQPGDENRYPPGRYRLARCGNPNPHRLIADWLGLMEPARGESCPSGQRRGRAAHGEDKVPSPDQNSFQISTTPTNQGPRG